MNKFLWCLLAFLITNDSNSECSKTPSQPLIKPFCTLALIFLLSFRNFCSLFLRSDEYILYSTGCNVIGLKFNTSLGSPFLYNNIEIPLLHTFGVYLEIQQSVMIL